MSSMPFRLSAFGDEIDQDLSRQLQLLQNLGIYSLDFRSAWGKSVKDLDDQEIALVASTCQEYRVAVSGIGIPVGKSPIKNSLISALLQHLAENDFQRLLAVEPHPFWVDGQGELGKAAGMTYAVNALRKLLADLQYAEAPLITTINPS